MNKQNALYPDWPAPKNIKALTTLRSGGFSQDCFSSFNLGSHVNDEPANVLKNREKLKQLFSLPSEPLWLNQVHGKNLIRANHKISSNIDDPIEADGVITSEPGLVCVILTADCLPVFFCNKNGTEVALAHAGWKSLALGILPEIVNTIKSPPEDLLVWLGPAIGPSAFEVGDEVRSLFLQKNPLQEPAFCPYQPSWASSSSSSGSSHSSHFHSSNSFNFSDDPSKRWYADIYQLAKIELNQLGVFSIYGANHCTFSQSDLFFSYRRDIKTGRMANLIWMDSIL